MPHVTTRERGWPAHFCSADLCRFRRNTLLEAFDPAGRRIQAVVVSTVGMWVPLKESKFSEVGVGRLFETMAFASMEDRIDGADVQRNVPFDSPWRLNEIDVVKADAMHEAVVAEIQNKMLAGSLVIPPAPASEAG